MSTHYITARVAAVGFTAALVALTAVGCTMNTGEVDEVDEINEVDEDEDVATAEDALICGHPYDGADPYATGCASGAYWVDPQRPVYIPGTSILVQLWYSPSCGTNWTELTSPTVVPYMRGKVVRKEDANYCRWTEWYEYYGGKHLWTDMVYAPTALARAGGTTTPGTGATWAWTKWY